MRHPRFLLEVFHISKLDHQLNEDIRDKEIRVIGPTGEQLGIMSSRDALAKAYDLGLDLVKISPNATPPVCKVMDYGKFRFEQTKKEKEAKKNQHVTEIKEVRMSPGIDTNDFNVKVKSALKFLKDGNRVKVTISAKRCWRSLVRCVQRPPISSVLPSWTDGICPCSLGRSQVSKTLFYHTEGVHHYGEQD